jgi:catechol-2,3-dioxygenase
MPASDTTLPPMRLGEIVLATGRYDAMTAWYRQLLGIEPSLEHAVESGSPPSAPPKPARMCFFRLHIEPPYQDVVAIFEMPGTRDAPSGDPGLHHMQLRNASLPDLHERYRRLRELGVLPYRAMDHGSSTSLYYRDPDDNAVEIAASNFATKAEFEACLASDAFRRNPAGKAIDPQSMLNL